MNHHFPHYVAIKYDLDLARASISSNINQDHLLPFLQNYLNSEVKPMGDLMVPREERKVHIEVGIGTNLKNSSYLVKADVTNKHYRDHLIEKTVKQLESLVVPTSEETLVQEA